MMNSSECSNKATKKQITASNYFVLDPAKETITTVDYDAPTDFASNGRGNKQICDIIRNCSQFAGRRIKFGKRICMIYFDAEGMCKPTSTRLCLFQGLPPIPGRVFLCGIDKEGWTIGTTVSAREIEEVVKFVDIKTAMEYAELNGYWK